MRKLIKIGFNYDLFLQINLHATVSCLFPCLFFISIFSVRSFNDE